MTPESRDALLAKARGWIDDIRLGCIASFAEIAERQGPRGGIGCVGLAAPRLSGGTESA